MTEVILTLLSIAAIAIVARYKRSTKYFEQMTAALLIGMFIGSGLHYAIDYFNHDAVTPVEQRIESVNPTKDKVTSSVVKKENQLQLPLGKGSGCDKPNAPQTKTEPRCRTDPAILNDS